MAEITKINIDGVVYDIVGDTSYVENETLVISRVIHYTVTEGQVQELINNAVGTVLQGDY